MEHADGLFAAVVEVERAQAGAVQFKAFGEQDAFEGDSVVTFNELVGVVCFYQSQGFQAKQHFGRRHTVAIVHEVVQQVVQHHHHAALGEQE